MVYVLIGRQEKDSLRDINALRNGNRGLWPSLGSCDMNMEKAVQEKVKGNRKGQ